MKRTLLALWLLFCASPALAFSCPDYYRFTDLGLLDSTGALNAGGPRVRAEGFDGTGLLDWASMRCLDLPFLRTDGFGNTIPVVEQVIFDPAALPPRVVSLRVERDLTLRDAAFDDLEVFRSLMVLPDTITTRGDSFVCVAPTTGPDLMCQFPQVYEGPEVGDLPLFVICEARLCSIIALPVHPELGLSATWTVAPDGLTQSAPMLFDKVTEIKGFIDALM